MKKPGTFILDFSGCTAQTDEMEPRTNGHIPNPPSLTAQNPQPVKAVHLSAGNCIFFCHNKTTCCSQWQSPKWCTVNYVEKWEASLCCCHYGVIFVHSPGGRAAFNFPSLPFPVFSLLCPLAKGPPWLWHFGAGILETPVQRREISGTTWQIQRTLVEAADTIPVFIHLLHMEYKEEESTQRFLKLIMVFSK